MNGRCLLTPDRPTGRVRVVEFPDPYPIRPRKIVEIEDLDGR
jgi:hypothetical protein